MSIDPAVVLTDHERCYGCGRGPTDSHCLGCGDFTPWPCLPYQMAEALAASEAKVAEAWDDGWNAADEEAAMLIGCRLPAPQGNPHRADPAPTVFVGANRADGQAHIAKVIAEAQAAQHPEESK
jgi:hypothetical protein